MPRQVLKYNHVMLETHPRSLIQILNEIRNPKKEQSISKAMF